jgi:hypothetical protein
MKAKDQLSLSIVQEHNQIKEWNEREERFTMSLLPNYNKLQNVPYGTNLC